MEETEEMNQVQLVGFDPSPEKWCHFKGEVSEDDEDQTLSDLVMGAIVHIVTHRVLYTELQTLHFMCSSQLVKTYYRNTHYILTFVLIFNYLL